MQVADVSPAWLRGMGAAELAAASARHEELRQRDQEKHATAEAKNSLEAYILQTRTDVSTPAAQTGPRPSVPLPVPQLPAAPALCSAPSPPAAAVGC